jgi:hypothetical protein
MFTAGTRSHQSLHPSGILLLRFNINFLHLSKRKREKKNKKKKQRIQHVLRLSFEFHKESTEKM